MPKRCTGFSLVPVAWTGCIWDGVGGWMSKQTHVHRIQGQRVYVDDGIEVPRKAAKSLE